jgi:anti-sigma regulatory factor (Ser/Thr protein kinase)
MEMIRSSAVWVSDATCVAEARREAIEHARALEWDDLARGQVALVATELATNLAKHARSGAVIMNSANGADRTLLQLVSVDQGPGITDVDRSLDDGFSTGGSSGTGLGAIRRLSQSLEVYSTPAKGTVLVAEMEQGGGSAVSGHETFAVGGVSVPRLGERVCGDAWDVHAADGGIAVLVVDGLGHGPFAADAARAAVLAFRRAGSSDPQHVMGSLHDALRGTRGAAAALALIDPATGVLRYCGIGNISAAIVDGTQRRNLVSHNGTLGHQVGTMAEFTYP